MATRNVKWGLLAFLSALLVVLLILLVTGIVEAGSLALVGAAIAVAAVAALIAWLIRYVATNSYMPFVIYRVALGSLVLVLLGTGVLTS